MLIEIDEDVVTSIVRKDLIDLRRSLTVTLEHRGEDRGVPVFSTDSIIDATKIFQLIESLSEVINFYGEKHE